MFAFRLSQRPLIPVKLTSRFSRFAGESALKEPKATTRRCRASIVQIPDEMSHNRIVVEAPPPHSPLGSNIHGHPSQNFSIGAGPRGGAGGGLPPLMSRSEKHRTFADAGAEPHSKQFKAITALVCLPPCIQILICWVCRSDYHLVAADWSE